MNLNKTFVLGNLTRDPEKRALPSGQAVCNFAIATNRFYTSNDGQKQQDTEFHNIVAFGKTADVVSQYLKKGSLVLIEGRLKTRNWLDTAGVKHFKTEVITERLQLAPRSLNPQGGGAQQPGDYNTPAPQQQAQQQAQAQPQASVPTVSQEDIPVIEEAGQVNAPMPEKIEQPEQAPKNTAPQDNAPQDDAEIDVKNIPF